MRNEPKRVTRYPIVLSSTRKNIGVASNFFEVWLDEKYQEDLVYCQRCKKIAIRQKRHNTNLVRHLKTHNQCNAPLRVVGHESRQIVKREGESTDSKSEVATCYGEGATAASDSACERERETCFTTTTDSISPTHLPGVEPNSSTSKGERVAIRFLIRGRSPSTYHIEAAPSDANLTASRTTQEEQTPTLPSPLLEAAPLQAAHLSTH